MTDIAITPYEAPFISFARLTSVLRIVAIVTFLMIGFKIAGYGFVPPGRRLAAGILLAAGVYFITTSDLGGRWTDTLREPFIDASGPALQGWMPPDDLKILRQIQWSRFAWDAYIPWVNKMRPEDRLEISGGPRPVMPPLEFVKAGDAWIGRLPKNPPPK